MPNLTVEYLGHACFRLTYGDQRIVLDPYADGSVPGYPPLRTEAEFVYCSHGHDDHNAADLVTLHDGGAPRFTLAELTVPHDHHGGARRGESVIRRFTFGGKTLVHLGDLGRPLTAEETAALAAPDVLLVPVGGYYTIDAPEAAAVIDALRPRITVPMHYRSDTAGYPVLAYLGDALPALLHCKTDLRVLAYGETLQID